MINHVIEIVNLIRNFDNIQFSYCNKFQTSLAKITKRSYCIFNDVRLYNGFIFKKIYFSQTFFKSMELDVFRRGVKQAKPKGTKMATQLI